MASVAELKKEESTLKGQVGDPLIDKTDILACIDWLKMRREWFITDVDRLRMKHTSFRRHIEGLVDTRIEARARVKSLEKAYSEVESRPPLRRLVRMADLNESFGRIAPERRVTVPLLVPAPKSLSSPCGLSGPSLNTGTLSI